MSAVAVRMEGPRQSRGPATRALFRQFLGSAAVRAPLRPRAAPSAWVGTRTAPLSTRRREGKWENAAPIQAPACRGALAARRGQPRRAMAARTAHGASPQWPALSRCRCRCRCWRFLGRPARGLARGGQARELGAGAPQQAGVLPLPLPAPRRHSGHAPGALAAGRSRSAPCSAPHRLLKRPAFSWSSLHRHLA